MNDQIDLDDERDIRAWARSLNATPDALRDAVRQVGGRPEAVIAYLSKQPKSTRHRWEWLGGSAPDGVA